MPLDRALLALPVSFPLDVGVNANGVAVVPAGDWVDDVVDQPDVTSSSSSFARTISWIFSGSVSIASCSQITTSNGLPIGSRWQT